MQSSANRRSTSQQSLLTQQSCIVDQLPQPWNTPIMIRITCHPQSRSTLERSGALHPSDAKPALRKQFRASEPRIVISSRRVLRLCNPTNNHNVANSTSLCTSGLSRFLSAKPQDLPTLCDPHEPEHSSCAIPSARPTNHQWRAEAQETRRYKSPTDLAQAKHFNC